MAIKLTIVEVLTKKRGCDKTTLGHFYFRFFMALRYSFNANFTFGNRKSNPIMLGKTKAKIMASENLITASKVAAEPITTKSKNKIL